MGDMPSAAGLLVLLVTKDSFMSSPYYDSMFELSVTLQNRFSTNL